MAKLIPSSLTGRLFVVSMLVIILFLPLAGLVLEKAYSNSLHMRLQEQLKVQVYGLMGLADELEPGSLWLPESLPDERFNQLGSGRYAQVTDSQGNTIWQSQSSLNIQFTNPIPDVPGEVNIEDINPPGQFFFERQRISEEEKIEATRITVIWEGADDSENIYTFLVAESLTPFTAERYAFRETLLLWIGGLAIFLLSVDVLALLWALHPLKQLAAEIRQVETGESEILETEYPTELNQVAKNLNALIGHEKQQRERYRNTLQDLAHSLKTPLSVLQGSLKNIEHKETKKNLTENISRMNNLISYQLQRAVSAGSNPIKQKVAIHLCLQKVFQALEKVYHDKNITFTSSVSQSSIFFGDENDLLEILGNLCDNACKYGKSKVIVEVIIAPDDKGIQLNIMDDGEGVPKALKQIIFERGKRLDEEHEGQGIGLFVVNDIVSSYKGSIDIFINQAGYNTVQVQLPGKI